jgi:hypothetical protein
MVAFSRQSLAGAWWRRGVAAAQNCFRVSRVVSSDRIFSKDQCTKKIQHFAEKARGGGRNFSCVFSDLNLESFFFARGQICPDFFVSVIYLAGAAGKKRAKKKMVRAKSGQKKKMVRAKSGQKKKYL